MLTRFGYAHGRRLAENMRGAFPWQSEREWQRAGGRLHMLHGLCTSTATSCRDDCAPACDCAQWPGHILTLGL